MNLIGLTHYATLSKTDRSGNNKVDISLIPNTPQKYEDEMFIGLTSVEMKFNDVNYTPEVDVKLYIGRHKLQTKFMNDLLQIGNNWEIKFGWNAYRGVVHENEIHLRRMQYYKHTIEYDEQARGFVLSIKLLCAPMSILKGIPLGLCTTAFNDFKTTNNILSLGYVIDALLRNAKEIVINPNVVNNNEKIQPTVKNLCFAQKVPKQSDMFVDDGEYFGGKKKTPNVISEAEAKEYIAEYKELKIWRDGNTQHTIFNPLFVESSEKDVPRPEDVRVVFFAENEKDAKDLYVGFTTNTMADPSKLHDVLNEQIQAKRYNVMSFISALLDDNGHAIHIMPHIINTDGTLVVIIVPRSAKLMTHSFGEYEFKGLVQLEMVATPSPYIEKSQPAILGPLKNDDQIITTFEKTEKFDLLSNKNIVQSISVSTDLGQSSIATSESEDNLARIFDDKPEKSNVNIDYKNNIYAIDLGKAIQLNVTTMGYPEISFYDNLKIDFANELFSGLYKVMRISHNMSVDSFSTSLEAQRILEGMTIGDGKGPNHNTTKPAKETFDKKINNFMTDDGILENANIRRFKYR